ncbi:MAG: histidine triad nucleotide-binding protein [Ignavibacteria bacterium]|nr:histidine triad nucleotide-binding protein [Ignavibacteria bacterium]MBT8383071.1 histidine triad nucleotide-binding protein [Ignavibacteria bacterium]MBT8392390.1 histidine triad nucleotide-binding protein [Ignavibacteria bacterium]NNJ52665.1 histidine triad nucleotide-binding protein [Ignavibacteriaceae bacterium]NNL22186.1 histidine triad nucleotide-binding protein [Ignavibacteriaceae bacterium]
MSTIFSKIINKEIPADIVYESENILAFRDINPQAPVHILIIPKIEIPKVTNIYGKEHAVLLGEMIDAANKLAKEMNIADDGFRLVFNCGNHGGQEVYHLHMHLLGGRKMKWPPG